MLFVSIGISSGFRYASTFRYSGPKTRNAILKNNRLNMISEPVRVRFAPSPTGSLHVGGARTALYNWLLAKQTKGSFIIRVEDTDEARSTKESEDMILNDLKWMNMNWDEGPYIDGPHGPYRQSERKDIYKKYADQLIKEGKAYPCFCTAEELEAQRLKCEEDGSDPTYDGTWRDADPALVQEKIDAGVPYTVRFKVPNGKVVSIDDYVRGTVTWDAQSCLGDFIMLRSTGVPVYNFCVAVDDMDMKITHVVRAEEHLSNSLRQLLIYDALDYTPPEYAHCSLILGSDRSKLSKRHGATSVAQFADQGFLPAAMMNYLATLGWNDGTDKEIYTPEELIEAFTLSRVVKSAAVFDMDKLRWINSQHIKLLEVEKLNQQATHVLSGGTGLSPIIDSNSDSDSDSSSNKFISLLAKTVQEKIDVTTDMHSYAVDILGYQLEDTKKNDNKASELTSSENFANIVSTLVRDYESGAFPTGSLNTEEFTPVWKSYMKALGKELDLKGKGLFHPVRLALTGTMSGVDVGVQIQLINLASDGAITDSDDKNFVSLKDRIEALKSCMAST